MSQAFSSSLVPILAAPWRQRRNRAGVWGIVTVVVLCLLAPVGLFAWSLFVDAPLAAGLRHGALAAGRIAAFALAFAWWLVLVVNVLEQNHPTPARLVPGHPGRLRVALLVAWAVLSLCLAGAVSGVIDTLTGIAIVAPVLALLAACMRWIWLCFATPVLPFLFSNSLGGPAATALDQAALAAWRAQPESIAAALVVGSGMVLAALIQSGGSHHAATYATRRNRLLRIEAAARGERAGGPGAQGRMEDVLNRPYHAWMRHLVSQSASSARARALLGLGPGVHWTNNATSLVATAASIGSGLVLLLIVSQVFPQVLRYLPMALSGVAIGTLFGVMASGIQVQSRLHQTRREQSLLALLPGVPRGPAQSRWLSWQLTAQFLLSWVGGVALMFAFGELARRLQFNPYEQGYATARVYMGIATLPLVVFQWRRWARLAAPTSSAALWPTLFGLGLAALAFAGRTWGLATPLECGAVFASGALAWCASRWWRMAAEPSALPVGRLA